MLSLFPHQVAGVAYLKSKPDHALLWDEQRVGKTPQMIVASGELGLDKVVIVTPVVGVGVWKHQWKQWDRWNRVPIIIPWSMITKQAVPGRFDVLILDEGHYAKNPAAQRSQRAFGRLMGNQLLQTGALAAQADRVWVATGTPMTHDPSDLFLTLKALFPQVLEAHGAFPEVNTYTKWRNRYCVLVNKMMGRRMIQVVVRGQNLDELRRASRACSSAAGSPTSASGRHSGTPCRSRSPRARPRSSKRRSTATRRCAPCSAVTGLPPSAAWRPSERSPAPSRHTP